MRTWQEIHPESQDKFFSGIGIFKGTAFLLGERKDGFGTGVALKRNGDGSWLEVAGPWRGRLLQITHGNGTYVSRVSPLDGRLRKLRNTVLYLGKCYRLEGSIVIE